MTRRRIIRFAGTAAAVLLLFIAGCGQGRTWYTVRWVDDGDTIVLDTGQKVRYIGINAPEIAHQGRKGEPFGKRAKALNRKWVLGKKIRLQFDRQQHDQYGRLLAYVFLEDGTFINRRLVREGLAYCLYLPPNTRYHAQLLADQRQAMEARRGIWAGWRKRASRYIASKRSRRFHLPACPFGKKISPKNRVIFDSKWDAFYAGYAPAKRCIRRYWSY